MSMHYPLNTVEGAPVTVPRSKTQLKNSQSKDESQFVKVTSPNGLGLFSVG